MDVDCESCGHRESVGDAEVARGPVEVTCADCGAVRLVTKKGHSIAAPRRAPHEEPLDLAAIADSDAERLTDLASIARQSESGRASRLEPEDQFGVPPSVRANIRTSFPPPPQAPIEEAPRESAPERRPHRGRFAVGIAGVVVVAAVAIGHASMSSEADGVERVIVTPFTPATNGPLGPQEIVGTAEARAVSAPSSEASLEARGALGPTAVVAPVGEPNRRAVASPSRRNQVLARPAAPELTPAARPDAGAPRAPDANADLIRAMENAVKAPR
jgi:hypothetical protein